MLAIKNLNKTYPNGTKALNNVNLIIEKGMFGLLGPNGAGKSSLMRTIKNPEELRKILGYLPQDFGVYPKVSAEMMLDHIARIKGIVNKNERKSYVAELLNKVNLYKFKSRNLGDFSGGMRQRFGIAQALLGNPKLIIVDEPTAGLDPLERNRFHNLLSELGENAVVILSTHIVDDVTNLCQKMAVFNEGKILVEGNPQQLSETLNGKVFKKHIQKSELESYETEFTILSNYLRGGKFYINVYHESHPGDGFETVTNDLEDFYFYAINKKEEQEATI